MKYKDWLTEWHSNYVTPMVKPKTGALYSDMIRLYIVPMIGEEEVECLTTRRLQEMIRSLLEGGLSTSTVNLVISVLKSSLKRATIVGILENSPADRLMRPQKREKKVECFSGEEQRKIINSVFSCSKKKNLGIVICLYTGVRIGELLALEWEDVDLKSGIISVNKTRVEIGKDILTGTPKTYSSNRIIPLPKQLIPIMRDLKKEGAKQVISHDGKPISIRSYQKSFELLLKRQGIPRRGFHALRHTFATRAVECGMDVKTLSEILGHSNPTVTLNRYVHSLESHKREMMNKLGKTL